MKPALGFAHRLCLVVVPVVTSSAIAALPTQAATFAVSKTVITFRGFAPDPPFDISTFTTTDTSTVASSPGSVFALANATAGISPEEGGSLTRGKVKGSGLRYAGAASALAAFDSYFSVNANQQFSIDLFSILATSIDNPAVETASAFSLLEFQLFDQTNNKELTPFSFRKRIDSTTGLTTATFSEVFSYTPTSSVNLRLVGVQINQAEVTTIPAPGGALGLLGMGLMFCFKKWRTRLKDDAAAN